MKDTTIYKTFLKNDRMYPHYPEPILPVQLKSDPRFNTYVFIVATRESGKKKRLRSHHGENRRFHLSVSCFGSYVNTQF